LLALVIKKNYENIDKNILRFRILNYRLLKIAKLQGLVLKEIVGKKNQAYANALLTNFEDLIKMNLKELSFHESMLDD